MHISIIAASTRAKARSRDVSDYIAGKLSTQVNTVSLIDLHRLALPLYDDSQKTGEWSEQLHEARQKLASSDGFVFVSPEWDGMMSVGLINFFHYLSQELADKPVYLVGVSSGRGGRYPLLQMRQMGYKNKHFVVIPESLYVDAVNENLVDGEMKNKHIEKRLSYGLKTLLEYAKAMSAVRASGVIDYTEFSNGW